MRDLEISKELLIEILGSEYKQRLVDWFQIEDDNFLRTYYDCGSYDDKGRPTGLGLEINIYEFVFKCKEWARDKYNITISSALYSNYAKSWNVDKDKSYTAETEAEVIIKACEWILKNKAND